MQSRNTTIFSTLIVVLFLASCGKKEQQAPPAPQKYPVQTIVVQDEVIYQTYAANLEGQQNVAIRAKINGFIQKVYVDEGQVVRKGQLLFKIETNTQNQDAQASKAAVNAAQVEVDRLMPLVKRDIIGTVVLETAKAKLAQAKSIYKSLIVSINFGNIKSPVDGVIGSLLFREGSLVSTTSVDPLTTVSDTRKMRAYFTLNEKEVLHFSRIFEGINLSDKIKKIAKVELVLVDNSIYDQKGIIDAVNGMVNAGSGSTQFRALFSNPQGILRNGSTGTIRLPIELKDIMLVPQNAVFELQGKQLIYVVGKENKVQSRIIETNGTSELNYIVTKGLKPGELVVTQGASKLKDGNQIVPVKAKTKPAANSSKESKPNTSKTK
jgi:membrane fusion protein (multidrug efflux system)